jgi:5-methylcytosine-specific restriction endonuclease McrA
VTAKPCLDCGRVSTNGSRCANCEQHRRALLESRRNRGTRQQRGYTAEWAHIVKVAIGQSPRCTNCGDRVSLDNPLTGDHIVPLAKGGQSVRDNCQVLCRRCNSSKAATQTG